MSATRRLPIALMTAFVALAAGVALAGIKVQVDHDPAFDFTPLHTWTWHPKGPGNAVKIITEDDDSAAFKKEVEPKIMNIVESEFTRRGFARPAGTEPDFYVTYYALVTVGNSEQYMGQFVNAAQWGLPPVTPSTTSLKVYPRGSLILDVTSRTTNEVVWRGVAQAELKWDDPQDKREKRVREAVQELLKKFPPKSGKNR
jgi:hypothetical protein